MVGALQTIAFSGPRNCPFSFTAQSKIAIEGLAAACCRGPEALSTALGSLGAPAEIADALRRCRDHGSTAVLGRWPPLVSVPMSRDSPRIRPTGVCTDVIHIFLAGPYYHDCLHWRPGSKNHDTEKYPGF